MANYYSYASFIVPGTPEQAAWLTRVDAIARELIEVNAGEGEKPVLEGVDKDIVAAAKTVAEEREGCPSLEITAEGRDHIWMCDNGESIDLDYTGALVHEYLKHFDLDDLVEIQWANTCDKPRLDAYGGGVMIVGKSGIECMDTSTAAEQLRAKFAATQPKASLKKHTGPAPGGM